MSVELTQDIMTLLTSMQATLQDLCADVSAVHAELKAKPPVPAEPRRFYSVEEVAEILKKDVYTVREWCRLGRIVARKRAERRGGAALWSISPEEVTRYMDEGLLPIDPSRNAER